MSANKQLCGFAKRRGKIRKESGKTNSAKDPLTRK